MGLNSALVRKFIITNIESSKTLKDQVPHVETLCFSILCSFLFANRKWHWYLASPRTRTQSYVPNHTTFCKDWTTLSRRLAPNSRSRTLLQRSTAQSESVWEGTPYQCVPPFLNLKITAPLLLKAKNAYEMQHYFLRHMWKESKL